MAEHNEIGKIGENLATSFLIKQNFEILERSYRNRYGEIDIIAQKDRVLRFIEVKSIKVRDLYKIDNLIVRPEENLTNSKFSKFIISVETYLKYKSVSHETKYQLDLACVYINPEKKEGRVRLIENIHKE